MHPQDAKQIPIRAFPADSRSLRSTPGVSFLLATGILLLSVGLVATVGAHFVAEIQPYAETLVTFGFDGGPLALAGLLLIGVGMAARYPRIHATTLLTPGAVDKALEEVSADLADLTNRQIELQGNQQHARTEIEVIKQEVVGHRREDRSKEAHDALYRLAASLDQLAAQIGRRIDETASTLQDSVYELSSLVEASRDFLHEGAEESGRELGELSDLVERMSHELADLAERAAEFEVPASPPSEVPTDVVDHDEDEYVHTELEIEVELEDEGQELGLDGAPLGLGVLDELQFADEPEPDDHGTLGVLDDLDDFDLEDEDDQEEPMPEPALPREVTRAPEPTAAEPPTHPQPEAPAAQPDGLVSQPTVHPLAGGATQPPQPQPQPPPIPTDGGPTLINLDAPAPPLPDGSILLETPTKPGLKDPLSMGGTPAAPAQPGDVLRLPNDERDPTP